MSLGVALHSEINRYKMLRENDENFENCPICGSVAQVEFEVPNERNIDCDLCGYYTIDINQFRLITTEDNRHIVSGYVRNRYENRERVYIEWRNVEELIEGISTPQSPLDYIDELVTYFHKNITRANDDVELSIPNDYSLFYFHDREEFDYILDKAKDLNYIEEPYHRGDFDEPVIFRLTLKGWEKAEELRKGNDNSKKAFVAMWFKEALNEIWRDGFYQVLDEIGYEPVRIDQIEHNNKICDEIIAEINKCSLLIADFTGHRGGVYFEAGYAMGKDIPVIWTCQADDIDDAHFDTRQYNHITWNGIDDLRHKLKNRIEATIQT